MAWVEFEAYDVNTPSAYWASQSDSLCVWSFDFYPPILNKTGITSSTGLTSIKVTFGANMSLLGVIVPGDDPACGALLHAGCGYVPSSPVLRACPDVVISVHDEVGTELGIDYFTASEIDGIEIVLAEAFPAVNTTAVRQVKVSLGSITGGDTLLYYEAGGESNYGGGAPFSEADLVAKIEYLGSPSAFWQNTISTTEVVPT